MNPEITLTSAPYRLSYQRTCRPSSRRGSRLAHSFASREALENQWHAGDREAQYTAKFADTPDFIAILEGPEFRFVFANQRYIDLIGHRDVVGLPFESALHDAVEQGYLAVLKQVYRKKQPAFSTSETYYVQVSRGAPVIPKLLDFVLQPILDVHGDCVAILSEGNVIENRFRQHHR